jgi:molecular chaperone GrpE (heat shock protein)
MSNDEREREEERRETRIKVTDRRRVHADEPATEPGQTGEPPAGGNDDPHAPFPEYVIGTARPAEDADELEQARRQAAEYREHLQRLQAEFDNYRKRVIKEQTRAVDMASEPLVRRLLEVLDEFDLALMHAEQKPDFDRFLHGVELVYAKLKESLRAEGVQQIDARGKPFDPQQHEALMQSGDGDGEPVVADVLRQGYTMKGRVIRPAGVKVTRK